MTQTNENGSSRLDRIEALILEMATANLRHDTAIDRHNSEFSRINTTLESTAEQLREIALQQRESQAETRASINDLISMIGTLSQNADLHWNAIQEMQSEVRGLQTENRRILDRLERHTNDGHGWQQ